MNLSRALLNPCGLARLGYTNPRRYTLRPIDVHQPGTRSVHGHEDGFGLNDSITILADARDPNAGGASHRYGALAQVPGEATISVLEVQFQHGPRDFVKSKPGITDTVMTTILIDRFEGYQAGPYACEANQRVLEHLRAAQTILRDRAIERAHRGVLGKNEK